MAWSPAKVQEAEGTGSAALALVAGRPVSAGLSRHRHRTPRDSKRSPAIRIRSSSVLVSIACCCRRLLLPNKGIAAGERGRAGWRSGSVCARAFAPSSIRGDSARPARLVAW
jgi:hypothetical protein